jgi:hypothetical protein
MSEEKMSEEMIKALNDDRPESLQMAKKLRMRNLELKGSLEKSGDLNQRLLEKLIRVSVGLIGVKTALERMAKSTRSTRQDRAMAKQGLSVLEVAKEDIEAAKKINIESKGLQVELKHPENFN